MNVGGEPLLNQLLRRMSDAEARDGGLLAQLLELLAELGVDPLARDLDRDLLRARPGLLDLDRILELLVLLFNGGAGGGFVLGHGILSEFAIFDCRFAIEHPKFQARIAPLTGAARRRKVQHLRDGARLCNASPPLHLARPLQRLGLQTRQRPSPYPAKTSAIPTPLLATA